MSNEQPMTEHPDTSDIPEAGKEFFDKAELRLPAQPTLAAAPSPSKPALPYETVPVKIRDGNMKTVRFELEDGSILAVDVQILDVVRGVGVHDAVGNPVYNFGQNFRPRLVKVPPGLKTPIPGVR